MNVQVALLEAAAGGKVEVTGDTVSRERAEEAATLAALRRWAEGEKRA